VDKDKDDMSSFKHGDRVQVSGGTYKYHHAIMIIKNAGAFSAKILLESTGEEKKIRRHNLHIVSSQQQSPSSQPHQRNTAMTSGATSNDDTIKT
jgi:hypothetical protein